MRDRDEQTKKMGNPAFKKRHISGTLHPHAEGISPAELPSVEADEGAGPPNSGGGGGAVGPSMLIFLLTASKVLSIFLRAPNAVTPCTSSACPSITTISFHDIPSKFGMLMQSERAQPPSNVFKHRRVEIFLVFLRAAAVAWA
jgi:hypothetical protein